MYFNLAGLLHFENITSMVTYPSVSKPDAATQEYRKKSAQLTKYVQRKTHVPIGYLFFRNVEAS